VNVFITGGSRGIGRAIALRFARDGAERVAIGYFRSDRAAEETAEDLRALGAVPTLVRGNVTSERVLEEVAALGPLDVLVHNAASGVSVPALEATEKHWDWTVNTNARALLQLAQREEGVHPFLGRLADADKDPGGARHAQLTGRGDGLQAQAGLFAGTPEMRLARLQQAWAGALQHEPDGGIHVAQLQQLVAREDAAVGVWQQTRLFEDELAHRGQVRGHG